MNIVCINTKALKAGSINGPKNYIVISNRLAYVIRSSGFKKAATDFSSTM